MRSSFHRSLSTSRLVARQLAASRKHEMRRDATLRHALKGRAAAVAANLLDLDAHPSSSRRRQKQRRGVVRGGRNDHVLAAAEWSPISDRADFDLGADFEPRDIATDARFDVDSRHATSSASGYSGDATSGEYVFGEQRSLQSYGSSGAAEADRTDSDSAWEKYYDEQHRQNRGGGSDYGEDTSSSSSDQKKKKTQFPFFWTMVGLYIGYEWLKSRSANRSARKGGGGDGGDTAGGSGGGEGSAKKQRPMRRGNPRVVDPSRTQTKFGTDSGGSGNATPPQTRIGGNGRGAQIDNARKGTESEEQSVGSKAGAAGSPEESPLSRMFRSGLKGMVPKNPFSGSANYVKSTSRSRGATDPKTGHRTTVTTTTTTRGDGSMETTEQITDHVTGKTQTRTLLRIAPKNGSKQGGVAATTNADVKSRESREEVGLRRTHAATKKETRRSEKEAENERRTKRDKTGSKVAAGPGAPRQRGRTFVSGEEAKAKREARRLKRLQARREEDARRERHRRGEA